MFVVLLVACGSGQTSDNDRDGWSDANDCDDHDPAIHPEAADDYGDGVDSDCDGSDVGPATDLSLASSVMIGGPYDSAGAAMAGGDVNGDGTVDLIVGAPNVGALGDSPYYLGHLYVVFGPVTGDGALSAADFILVGEDKVLGDQSVATGDVLGVGHEQVIAGYPWGDIDYPMGVVMVFSARTGMVSFEAEAADFMVVGDVTRAEGSSVLAGRDLNGDGAPDLATGIKDWDGGPGLLAVHGGPLSGVSMTSDADVLLQSLQPGDEAGSAIAYGGDVNGDGSEDVLVGAPGMDGRGAVYVAYGPFVADENLETDVVLATVAGGLGSALVGVPDQDGDGFAELAIGAPIEADEHGVRDGAVYLIHGPVEGSRALTDSDRLLAGEPGAGFLGMAFGWSQDGDDEGALFVAGQGDYFVDPAATGNVYEFAAGGLVTAVWHGEELLDRAGDSILAGADLDGNGLADLAIGASESDRGGTSSGAVYVIRDVGKSR